MTGYGTFEFRIKIMCVCQCFCRSVEFFCHPPTKIIFCFFCFFIFFVNIFRGSCHPLFNFLLLASPVLGHLLGLFGDFAGWAGMGWAYIGCADMGQTGVPWAWHWLGWHGRVGSACAGWHTHNTTQPTACLSMSCYPMPKR